MKAGNERRVCGYDRVASPPRAVGLKSHLICHQTRGVQHHLISWHPLLIDGTAPTPGRGVLGVRHNRPRGRAVVLVPSQEIGQRSREAFFRKYGYRKVRISAANRPEWEVQVH